MRINGGDTMIPWWAGLALFFAGMFVSVFIIALTNADRGD